MTWQRRARIAKHFCLRTGVLRARPAPWAGRSRVSSGRACRGAGKRGRGGPSARSGHRGARDGAGKGVKTSCRLLEGRSRAPCAPPVPDSLELPPAAAPVRTAGSHRRVSALLKSPQMPREGPPCPPAVACAAAGTGPPTSGRQRGALPFPALPLAVPRLARTGLAGARQDSEGKADAGRPPRLPERRSCTRGSAQLPRASPGREARWKRLWSRPARTGREQEAAVPLLAELRQGHPWVFLSFCCCCLLVGLGFGVDLFQLLS